MSIHQTKYLAIATLVAISLLSGCATMSESECTSANWQDVGLQDGTAGKKASRHAHYQKECGAFGATVDTHAYDTGWESGIVLYCTRDNGYQVGASGKIYQHNCPVMTEDAFFSAYQLGHSIHVHQFRVNSLRRQIDDVGNDLAKSDLSEERRKSLAKKRKSLKRDLEGANITVILAKTTARSNGFVVY